jgi:predicted permease
MSGWLSRLRRRPAEREFANELQSHLAHAIDEQVERGLLSDEARTAALRRFGNVTRHLERFREASPTFWLEELWQDVRYALRSSRRSPTFSAAAILTLGLGLGANAALFTITSAALMNTLPVQRPHELVEIGCTNPRNPQDACRTHYPGFLLFRERGDILSGVFAFAPAGELAADIDGRAEIVDAMFLSGDAYAVLGMSPVAGRLLTAADDAPGAPLAAVIGHQFWQRRFGGDTQAIGRTVRMGNQMVTIVGVTPPAFRGLTVGFSPDVTLATSAAEIFRRPGSLQSRAGWWLYIMGRLKQGVSLDQARVALDPVYRNTLRMTMDSLPPAALEGGVKSFIEGLMFRITPAATGGISEFRHMLYQPLRILWGVAALVLLVTCANLAGLLLSRAADRRREFGVRLALGAGPARVTRQVITEALVLAGTAGALAVIIARWVAPLVLVLGAGEGGVRALDIRVDGALLAFTALLSILSGLAIGTGFVRRVLATDPAEAWRSSMTSGSGRTVARTLLVTQMALSIVLLTIATLFVTSLSRARSVDAGFDKEQLITASVLPGIAGHRGEATWTYLRRILAAAETVPGVRAATYHAVPIGTGLVSQTSVRVPGHDGDAMVMRRTAIRRDAWIAAAAGTRSQEWR